nr:MAG TPA: antirepressor protein [Caudoviricetes sp.]
MNELSTMIVDDERMTSLQIAEITGKAHKDVMRAIRNMEPAWENVCGRKFALTSREVNQPNGGIRETSCFSLNKEECLYIATKFNDEARAKLIKRWKELEEQHQKTSVPQNYLEALKSLVKAEEEKQQLALENKQKDETIITISKANVELGNKITEMLPKVSYYDRILQSNATMTITQIAQDYGMSAIAMNKELESMRIQHKERGQWILYAQFLKGGYVHSRAVDIIRRDGMHDVKYNTEWTTKGRIFLYEALKGKGILPLIEQENTPRDKGTGGREPSKTSGASQQTINFE